MTYSPSEQRLLDIITKAKPGVRISTKDLAERFYDGRERPEHADNVITGIVRSLTQKTKLSGCRVRRTERRGPRPIEVWYEER